MLSIFAFQLSAVLGGFLAEIARARSKAINPASKRIDEREGSALADEGIELIRSLIDKIELWPKEQDGGVEAIRAIARRLNEEHVPGPESRPWQDTTIRGQKERGTGIPNNELYISQLVWNRCSYVKDRYGCAGLHSKGICANNGTISRHEIEGQILRALKQNLLTPEPVAEFTRAYQEEVNRLAKEASGKAAEVEAMLASLQRKIDGIMRAIEDGLYQPSTKARLAELETEKAALVASCNAAQVAPNVLVHPNLAAVYRRKVEELESLLETAEH